jgi:hypothetical protein
VEAPAGSSGATVLEPPEQRVVAASPELEVVGAAIPLWIGIGDCRPIGVRPVHEIGGRISAEPGLLRDAFEVRGVRKQLPGDAVLLAEAVTAEEDLAAGLAIEEVEYTAAAVAAVARLVIEAADVAACRMVGVRVAPGIRAGPDTLNSS